MYIKYHIYKCLDAHKLDYVAAQEPILGLGNSVRTVVEGRSSYHS